MLELVQLHQTKSNPSNPRTWTRKDLNKSIASIKEFPQMLWVRPCVTDASGTVNGGNLRRESIKAVFELSESERKKLYAANCSRCNDEGKELARLFFIEKKFPIYRASEFTEEQAVEFIIKDNGSFGDWDMEALANQWSELPLSDWGIKGLDFDTAEEETKPQKPRKAFLKIEFESDEDLGNCRVLIQDIVDKQGFDVKITASLEVF